MIKSFREQGKYEEGDRVTLIDDLNGEVEAKVLGTYPSIHEGQVVVTVQYTDSVGIPRRYRFTGETQ
jgi:hypothetical protein